MPKEVALALKTTYYQTAANNAVLFKELDRILAAFAEAEIPVIVLKGAALAQTLYPDPGLRPMGDLDLFVRPEDFNVRQPDAAGIGLYPGKSDLPCLSARRLRGPGDIGTALEPGVGWPGAQPGNQLVVGAKSNPSPRMAQHPVYTLNPAAQFVYLTGHLMLQTDPQRRRLIWFYDLFQLYEQHLTDFDWEGLLKGEATKCWASWMQVTLYQLRDLFGIRLPAALTDTPAQSPHRPDTRTITRNYIQNALSQLRPRHPAAGNSQFAVSAKELFVMALPHSVRLDMAFVFTPPLVGNRAVSDSRREGK